MSNHNEYFNVLKTENFLDSNEQEQTQFIKVGVAFPHSSDRGLTLKITDGISVTGDLVILPPKQKTDLQGQYQG